MDSPGAVTGGVRHWLRAEGLAVLVLVLWLYARGRHSWIVLLALFFAPDLAFVGYVAGPRAGALAYNALHSYVGPVVAAVVALGSGQPPVVALIWAAHIGFDRFLGYGLKYPSAFGDTHLGQIGRAATRGRAVQGNDAWPS